MEYYAAIKRNEILPFARTWMELDGIILSKISQSENDSYYMISLIEGSWEAVWVGLGSREGKNETRWDQEGVQP